MADAVAPEDDNRLFCYRHPDRETWIRCGRCDRPICTRCAMQGPVGFRCRTCGTLANDPLRTIRPTQALIGFVVAAGLGAAAGLVASRIGFFSIFISFIAGGFIAEAVNRLIGFKRGPLILVLVLGGIVAGTAVSFGLDFLLYSSQFANIDVPPEMEAEIGSPMAAFLVDQFVWAAISAGAACVGAFTRLR
jgi:hypothetical protein